MSAAPPDADTFIGWIEETSQVSFEHPEQTRQRIESHIDNSVWVLSIIEAAVARNWADTPIVQYLIGYLNDDDLARLAGKYSDLPEKLVLEIGLQNPALVPASRLEDNFEFSEWGEDFDILASPPTFHLIFDDDWRPSSGTYPKYLPDHPTWHLKPMGDTAPMGGLGTGRCPSCQQPLIHLITLGNEVVRQLSVSLPQVRIETCPNCWEKAYYRHDELGIPARIEPVLNEGFEFENVPLVEQVVQFSRTPPRWLRQTCFATKQNLFKLGGFPSWVQANETPVVPGTNRKMQLLLQMDSHLPTIDGGELLWGSGGVFYVFWDNETRTSCHFGQWS